MIARAVALAILILVGSGSGVTAAERKGAKRPVAKADRASVEFRTRLALYLQALQATPEELEALRKRDRAEGIWLMERNPFLRARLELVALLSPERRKALLEGKTYLSPPYAELPPQAQAFMDSALGTDRLAPELRKATRYQLQRRFEDDVEYLMINQVDPTGRPRSGGSVLPGVRPSVNAL